MNSSPEYPDKISAQLTSWLWPWDSLSREPSQACLDLSPTELDEN